MRPLQDQARNVAREAGRQRNEPLVLLREQVHVDAGLVVVALDEPGRAELDEVLIALLVFAQEHQVRVFAGDLGLVKAAALGDVDLAPDDRMNARLLAGLVEVDHAVHHAPWSVIARDSMPSSLARCTSGPDAAGAVQQGVFGVQMQVRKGHARSPPVFFQISTLVLVYHVSAGFQHPRRTRTRAHPARTWKPCGTPRAGHARTGAKFGG